MLNDSEAGLVPGEMLLHHQTAIVTIQHILAKSQVNQLYWLDFACGRGQILTQLKDNISDDKMRERIIYHGIECNESYVGDTKNIAGNIGIGDYNIQQCEIENFLKAPCEKCKYNFISIINALHEIPVNVISELVVNALDMLTDDGLLYVFDYETLDEPELGAVTFFSHEIVQPLAALQSVYGDGKQIYSFQRWQNFERNSWSFFIYKNNFCNVTPNQPGPARDNAIANFSIVIKSILAKKLDLCKSRLEALTCSGPLPETERYRKYSDLSDFWTLSRAMEAVER